MKRKIFAVLLTGAMLTAGLSTTVFADGEKHLYMEPPVTVKRWEMQD